MIRRITSRFLYGNSDYLDRQYRINVSEDMLKKGASAEEIREKLGILEVDNCDAVWH